jgi:hypothetical protein
MTYTDEATNRLRRPDFDRWMDQASSTGYCAQPVRLVGYSETYDAVSGEHLSTYASTGEPDGVTYVRCGNRRAARCPSCSHEYKSDMWHLVIAGAAGGSKGVPESVSEHPLAFVTLTAPSFGAVHSAKRAGHGTPLCRPRSKKQRCTHGRPMWCMQKHDADSELAGEPLCHECYDYEGHIAWQWHAPELWRRFVIRLRRDLAHVLGMSEKASRELVRVQFAKVAEFQRRGIVHFHALIRLDGNATDDDAFPPPAISMTSGQLAELAEHAAHHVTVIAEPLPGTLEPIELRWGTQCDSRAVKRSASSDSELTDRAVAAYIAKYATKATEDVVDPSKGAGSRPHITQLRQLIAGMGRIAQRDPDSPYLLLGRWESMLGFRGHFSTKSRRYSTTLGRLRSARRRWQRQNANSREARVIVDLDSLEAEETTLVIGQWSFTGMGWLTSGDAALARQAAAAAREWQDSRRHKTSTTNEKRWTNEFHDRRRVGAAALGSRTP